MKQSYDLDFWNVSNELLNFTSSVDRAHKPINKIGSMDIFFQWLMHCQLNRVIQSQALNAGAI